MAGTGSGSLPQPCVEGDGERKERGIPLKVRGVCAPRDTQLRRPALPPSLCRWPVPGSPVVLCVATWARHWGCCAGWFQDRVPGRACVGPVSACACLYVCVQPCKHTHVCARTCALAAVPGAPAQRLVFGGPEEPGVVTGSGCAAGELAPTVHVWRVLSPTGGRCRVALCSPAVRVLV